MPTVQLLFDVGSPNAYLVHKLVPEIEARTGAVFEYMPILLGGIFKATNNVSPMVSLKDIPAKMKFMRREMDRFVSKHALTAFRMNPHFPINTLVMMRAAVAAQADGVFDRYIDAVFRGMWETGAAMGDPAVLHATLTDAGLDADALLARAQEASVKETLVANTNAAIARGVFGAPSFFVGDELFFGKDQLRDVEDEILAQRGRAA